MVTQLSSFNVDNSDASGGGGLTPPDSNQQLYAATLAVTVGAKTHGRSTRRYIATTARGTPRRAAREWGNRKARKGKDPSCQPVTGSGG
jgi:hypothetical protein